MRRACGQMNDRNHQKKSAPDEPARFFRVLGMILDGIPPHPRGVPHREEPVLQGSTVMSIVTAWS